LIAQRTRQALDLVLDRDGAGAADPLALERACKLANFFTQPFFCAEPWIKRPGSHVSLAESLGTCAEILDGVHDELPPARSTLPAGLMKFAREGGSKPSMTADFGA
jgi:F0F1-type ATP synthase beta subunit